MLKIDITNLFGGIIRSPEFKQELESLMANFSNLKQEYLIRDIFVRRLNEGLLAVDNKAFAEYPRGKGRVDLSVLNSKEPANPFLMELKYQFNKDYKSLSQFNREIETDFQTIKTSYGKPDLFMLIVHSWNRKQRNEFLKRWEAFPDLTNSLDNYCSDDTEKWVANVSNCWAPYRKDIEEIEPIKVLLTKPYEASYSFFFMFKKNETK
jgi:hypothetical protein